MATVEHYDVHVRGLSSKGKGWVRQYGSTWTVIGTSGPNVLILSPPTEPTHMRAVRAIGDPNFEVEPVDAARR